MKKGQGMKKEEEKELLACLQEEEIDPGLLPAGATIRDIETWALGFQACAAKVKEWTERPARGADPHYTEEPWTEKEMGGDEDRDQIIRILKKLLQHTRAGADLVSLIRTPGNEMRPEMVRAEFLTGMKRQSIDGDSGIAIIRDVLKMFD